jgi:hypothetical protein
VKPVTLTTTVPRSRQEVYEFLERLANHETFMDRMFTDWEFFGPERGVGARARARTNTPAAQDRTEFEIIEAEPGRIVEAAVSAGGRRRTRGTYVLEDLRNGRTRISFEFAWLEPSRLERVGPPLARAFVRRAYKMAMRRLARNLAPGASR